MGVIRGLWKRRLRREQNFNLAFVYRVYNALTVTPENKLKCPVCGISVEKFEVVKNNTAFVECPGKHPRYEISRRIAGRKNDEGGKGVGEEGFEPSTSNL